MEKTRLTFEDGDEVVEEWLEIIIVGLPMELVSTDRNQWKPIGLVCHLKKLFRAVVIMLASEHHEMKSLPVGFTEG